MVESISCFFLMYWRVFSHKFVVFMRDWFFFVLDSARAFIVLISGIRGYDGVQQDNQGSFAMDVDVQDYCGWVCGVSITCIRCMYPPLHMRVDPTRHDRFSRVCEVDVWSHAWCTRPVNDAQEKEKSSQVRPVHGR